MISVLAAEGAAVALFTGSSESLYQLPQGVSGFAVGLELLRDDADDPVVGLEGCPVEGWPVVDYECVRFLHGSPCRVVAGAFEGVL
jgi:hypothetical protein